jgi:hypothetical protein
MHIHGIKRAFGVCCQTVMAKLTENPNACLLGKAPWLARRLSFDYHHRVTRNGFLASLRRSFRSRVRSGLVEAIRPQTTYSCPN